MTRVLTRVPQPSTVICTEASLPDAPSWWISAKVLDSYDGRRASRKKVWSTATQERPNASKVSAASLRRTGIQRFGVNQNSTEARYALDSEFTAALGTLTSQPTDIDCHRGWPSKWDCDSQARGLVYQFLRTNVHRYGFDVAGIFWGLWLFPLGLLVYRSGFLPRILGVALMVNCFAFLISSLTSLVLPHYEALVHGWMRPFHFGEQAFMLWLLITGAKPRPLASPAYCGL